MQDLANIFKALSDESRLEILGLLLAEGELCVCDVEGVLGISQSKASRHLRYLLNAGLVGNRREGVWVHYLIPTGLDDARQEIVGAVERAISRQQRDELERKLNGWRAEKSESAASCRVQPLVETE